MAWFRRRLAADDGFTLVELLAALSLLMIGVLGVAATLNRTRDAVGISESRESAAHRVEREIERIRALPYADVGLTAMPADSADAADPASFMQGTKYQWDPSDASKVSDIVTGGTITSSTPWNEGRMQGTLHVFVTKYDDPAAAGPAQAKRVIVAIRMTGRYAPGRPVVASTVIHDPTVTP